MGAPLTYPQRLRVLAAAGMPVAVAAEDLREWAVFLDRVDRIEREQVQVEGRCLAILLQAAELRAEAAALEVSAVLDAQRFALLAGLFAGLCIWSAVT